MNCLLMSLKLIQGFYEEECRRGKMGLGNFSLKSKYKQFQTDAEDFQPRTLVCHPKDIVSSIRNRDFIVKDSSNDVLNRHASTSRIVRAKELVAQDLIAFSPRLGAFTVMDVNGIHVVRINPNESCSCPIKTNCIHILSVKLGLRMQLGENDLQPQNTAAVKKTNKRAKYGKYGTTIGTRHGTTRKLRTRN